MKRSKLFTSILAGVLLASIALTGCGGNSVASSSAASDATPAADTAGYPKESIQMIVPVKPGGDTDLNARLFAKYMEKELGQPIVIVNVDGASGMVGMDQVKNAKPDGYNLLFFHTEAMIPEIAGMVDYKLTDAFDMAGICLVDNTTVIATHKDAPYKTMKELIEYAKANPGKVEFGMATGGYPHLIGLALQQQLGAELNIVDVGANAAKTTALLGHKTDVINTQYGLNKEYFGNGEFISLGLCSPERNPLLPDVETVKEAADLNMDFNKFFFCAMPKGTPADITNKFSEAMKKVCENPEFIAEAEKSFLNAEYHNPADAVDYANKVNENLNQYKDLFVAATGK